MPRTTLVIPTCGRPGDLARCLGSIRGLRRGFDEILVVDQGDIAATRRAVDEHPGLNVAIRPLAVRSAAQARNAAIEAATGDILFFVDDDVTLDDRYVVNRRSILTPYRRAILTPPLPGTAEVVPVVHRGAPRGFV